jgi:hypothetical protein
MSTQDKIVATRGTVDDNINTRDQRRTGIWFLVITFLAILGLMSLGVSHSPGDEKTQEPNDMSGTGGNVRVDENPPGYSVNRPVGVVEWPGQVGKPTKYLTGTGNSPATEQYEPGQGMSIGVTPNTATDEASRKAATSGTTPSDSMAPPEANPKGGVVPSTNPASTNGPSGSH